MEASYYLCLPLSSRFRTPDDQADSTGFPQIMLPSYHQRPAMHLEEYVFNQSFGRIGLSVVFGDSCLLYEAIQQFCHNRLRQPAFDMVSRNALPCHPLGREILRARLRCPIASRAKSSRGYRVFAYARKLFWTWIAQVHSGGSGQRLRWWRGWCGRRVGIRQVDCDNLL